MTILEGARDALAAITTRRADHVEAALLAGPYLNSPPPEIKSPWAPDPDHLGTIVWSELLDTETALLSRAEAYAIPAVKRSRDLVATTLGRQALIAYRTTGLPDDDDQVLPVQPMVLRQPDPQQARFVMLTWTVDDLIFYGVSWWLVLSRLADGRPAHFRRIHPGGVVVHDGGRVEVYGKATDPRDVLRIDGPHEGILASSARTLREARALELSGGRFARNPVPAIELHQTGGPELDDVEIDALVAKWAKARAGADGGVAFTSRFIEAKVHGAPAEHLLTAGRNAAAIDCARVVGVPADAIDATPEHASMTYANVESRGRTLIDYGLAEYAAAIEGRLSMDDVLAFGTLVRFDLSGITAPSTSNESDQEPTA